MRYHVLACDYDGTLAHDGQVAKDTVAGLERLADSGRKLLLVTGRELDDLLKVFPKVELFDRVVAENGALLYRPADQAATPLGERPPDRFTAALRERGVDPLSVGQVIVATWHPNETTVLEVIRELGLELEVIFNKGAVMVLPPGVNKASGLAAALAELELSPHSTVGVGDAENDHAFLSLYECSVAVANALPALKERCDAVTEGPRGAGVVELIDRLLDNDLASLGLRLARHDVLLGTRQDGGEVRLGPQGTNVLVAGPSSSGKSDLVTGLLERLVERAYQVLVIDPEGDYETFPDVVHLGTSDRAPTVEEVLDALEDPTRSVVVSLLGSKLEDRPGFLQELLARLQKLRARTGRPHRIVIDEAHHLVPAGWQPADSPIIHDLDGLVLVAPHAGAIAAAALGSVELVVALGGDQSTTIEEFATAAGVPPPDLSHLRSEGDQVLAWWRQDGAEPFLFRYAPGTVERRRHIRKYAEGDLGEDKSFWFRGPDRILNLRAQNLFLFLQLGDDGVDDATWLHHLRQGDYARWFKDAIKDQALAAEAEEIRRHHGNDPAESRARLRQAIEHRYTTSA
jgi:hydroxymethylpyrimidine pyrophosphatase-like HAD family hydrolase